jgi:ribosomal subunit interface protein
MDIQLTGRNVTVNEGLRDYVNDRLQPVLADYPRVESCHVILAHEKYRFTAEVVVQGRDKLRAEADETTDDLYASIDAAATRSTSSCASPAKR